MKKVSLSELMGSAGKKAEQRKLSLDDLPELLGERMPKLEFNPLGRLRLNQALRGRFGDGYANLPGISDIIKEFDAEAKFEIKRAEMRMLGKGRK